MTTELVVWRGLDSWRVESALIHLSRHGLHAAGTQIGSAPVPYQLDYTLDAEDGFVTRSLTVSVSGQGWQRTLELSHDGRGGWICDATEIGDYPGQVAPGGDGGALSGAFDCDLGFSPLTNLMPIRRHGLHRVEGEHDFVMAWVSVPDLRVVASAQRYEHVRTLQDGAIVRYEDRGEFAGFQAELELDGEGLVMRYPDLAERVGPESARPHT